MTTTATDAVTGTTVRLPRPRCVCAGWYEVDAVGQTFTIRRVTEHHESLYPWHVGNEQEELVAMGTTLADALGELARYLAKEVR